MEARRAAQYLRMSTEHQRYSTDNQAAAIAVDVTP
jgi:DNA invertase Pin-like site-specific DNA recombinase